MQHRIKHLRGDRARTRSLVFVHPRILRQSAGSRSRLGWLHQTSFKTGRTDPKDAGLMGPTQDRRLGRVHQPSFKNGRTDTKVTVLMGPDRTSVVQGKIVSISVNIGDRRTIKKIKYT